MVSLKEVGYMLRVVVHFDDMIAYIAKVLQVD